MGPELESAPGLFYAFRGDSCLAGTSFEGDTGELSTVPNPNFLKLLAYLPNLREVR